MKNNNSSALTIVNSAEFAVEKGGLKQLQDVAVEQLRAVGELQQKGAMAAVITGLTLHRVKASMPHGSFSAWMKQKLTEVNFWTPKTAKINASYYMRLALIFIEKAKVAKPDVLALPGDQLILEVGDHHEAGAFFGKLEKFVGDASLNELLNTHGIKDRKARGGARVAGEVEKEAVDPETAALRARENLGEWFAQGRQLVLAENLCARLQPGEVRALVESLEGFMVEVRKAAKPFLKKAEG